MPTAELKKVRHVRFTVPGVPIGKGRPRARAIPLPNGKHAISMYTPSATKKYENLVRMAFVQRSGSMPHDGPVSVAFKAFFPIPKSRPKWWKEAAREQIIPHTTKPDMDNIRKSLMDGLNTVAFRDDSLVFSGPPEKWYSDTPRVEVFIDFYEIERVK